MLELKDLRQIKGVLKIRPVKAEIRILNALLASDIFYMQDLILKTKRELARLPGIGRKGVQRIEQALWIEKRQLRHEDIVMAQTTGLPDRRYGSRTASTSAAKRTLGHAHAYAMPAHED